MYYRVAFYLLLLAVGLLPLNGLGVLGPKSTYSALTSGVTNAAPLSKTSKTNSSTDNSAADNAAPVAAAKPTSTPPPTPTTSSAAVSAGAAAPKPAAGSAPTDQYTAQDPGPCYFTKGFQTLHDMIPTIVGACKDNEWHNPDNGDALQNTANGLLVWRKADNWTAFTDGSTTWLNGGPHGLVSRPNGGPLFPWEAAGPAPSAANPTPASSSAPAAAPVASSPEPAASVPSATSTPNTAAAAIGNEPTATPESPSQSGGASSTTQTSPLGDLSTFRAITQDTLDKLNAGDQRGATARIRDLETEWDNAEARLKPKSPDEWTKIDNKIDAALRQLRAVNPNLAAEKAALQELLDVLK